jgi:polyhydroxyalkanoate synthesis regulator protein
VKSTKSLIYYRNRKTYDQGAKRYISGPEILAWVREDNEIRVVDHETKADVTARTLQWVATKQGLLFSERDLYWLMRRPK